MRDHRENGLIERLIRTINERLRTNENIILRHGKLGLSGRLYVLRKWQKADKKLSFEKSDGRKQNTVKSITVEEIKYVSGADSNVNFTTTVVEEKIDPIILVRERTKGSMIEVHFERKTVKMKKKPSAQYSSCQRTSKGKLTTQKAMWLRWATPRKMSQNRATWKKRNLKTMAN